MKFEFSQYQYQTDAANAACDVFEGQPKHEDVSYIRDVGRRTSDIRADQAHMDAKLFDASEMDDDTGYRNADLELTSEQLLANIQGIQNSRDLVSSKQLFSKPLGAVSLDVEMERARARHSCTRRRCSS